MCYDLALPLIICLGRLHIAFRYIYLLTLVSGSRPFHSVVTALDFYLNRLGLHPTTGGKFLSSMLHSFVMTFMSLGLKK